MTKTTALALAFLTLAACDKSAEEQAKIDKAKSEQSQTITAANVEAEKKVQSANTEADKKIDKAENKANEKIGEANEALVKMKADFVKSKQDDLATLDKKLTDLDAKAMKATGPAKANAEMALKTAHAKRAAFASDLAGASSAPTVTWETTKTRLETSWTDLKKSVDDVKL